MQNACSETYLVIHLHCDWLAGETGVGHGRGEVMNLASDEAGITRVINWSRPETYDDVRCGIDSAVQKTAEATP
ncbi:hypothetical protein [Methyloligella halotolerans]|uniref:hypothetical protein n=1 Tax=Methyloligella halotolerans TaxID=1177755 RepID=UPI00083D6825|nr:hypothetical protein [Methyloligella halotolerans]